MPGAIDTWLRGVCGPGCRADLERAVPTALDDAVAAADVYVGRELSAVQARSFTEEDAHRVTQPALAVLGEESAAVFRDRRELLLAWLPDAEPFDLPRANHLLHVQRPRELARALADFFARHPVGAAA